MKLNTDKCKKRRTSFVKSSHEFSPVIITSKHTQKNIMTISTHLVSNVLDLVPKYHALEPTWPRSSVSRALDWYPKGRGFDSPQCQANFSACPGWIYTQSNIKNIIIYPIYNLYFLYAIKLSFLAAMYFIEYTHMHGYQSNSQSRNSQVLWPI